MKRKNQESVESKALHLLGLYGYDGAARYARAMESWYFSERWQLIGNELDKIVERARIAREVK